ncbi:MAG: BlaI/MecI/CopY family transcriptional regulator [Aureispira sp.]|nr:BlaI/MecI/CopY family transcriptional regulator [Aureispira sp.]
MNKVLTPLELKVMNILWTLKSAFVKDILEHWPKNDKKPAYNTVSTIVRILQNDKDFIDHKTYGRTHEYYPKITKGEYQKFFLQNAVDKVFSGSVSRLVSALVDSEKVSQGEIDDLKKLLDDME